jgi:hypothetical protein
MLNLSIIAAILAILVYFISYTQYYHEFSFLTFYPYVLLLTPFREKTLQAWQVYAPIEKKIIRTPQQIPEILAKGFYLIRSIFFFLIFFNIKNN